jgi:putative ABC transport system permease protein
MLGGLAGLSLLLAAVGVYGVLSQTVRERTREIGLRMAMGAGRREVLQMVLKTAFGPVLLGIAGGLTLASGLTRFLGSLLFGVQPVDAATFSCVAVALLTAALLASYFPARRATKVDPTIALRYE